MAASIAANREGWDEEAGAREGCSGLRRRSGDAVREMKTSRGDAALQQGKQKEAPWTSSCSFRQTAGEELGRLEHKIEQGGAAAG